MSKSVIIVALFAVFSTSCAAMQQAWRQQYCNHEGAYSAGMNDAREGKKMNTNFGYLCSEADQPAVKAAYREGFTSGTTGNLVVIDNRNNNGAVATAGPQQCVKAYGKEACGYNCEKGYGEVACGRHPSHNCVKAYGKIRCGLNCQKKFGDIVCD